MRKKSSPNRINEIFVSYSRDDESFVRTFIENLRQKGVDPWFDKENIDNGREWWQEIKKGVENANAFVFVISPSSLTSRVCHWELAYARKLGKRIIPLVYIDVMKKQHASVLANLSSANDYTPYAETSNAAENWQALQKIDFIFHTDQSGNAESVIHTARANFDHIDGHRRFLVRALEWDGKDRRVAHVLRGGDLVEAEAWLREADKAADKIEPKPTALQREYIRASQSARTARRRVAMIVVSVALVTLALLGVLLLNQMQETETQSQRRAEADATAARESLVSSDLRVIEYAQQLFADGQPNLALALVLQANAIDNPPDDFKSVLYDMAYEPAITRVFPNETPLAFSPDGRKFLTRTADDSRLLLRDIETWRVVHEFPGASQADWPRSSGIFSPDSTTLITYDGTKTVRWDIESGAEVATLPEDFPRPPYVFSHDGRMVMSWQNPDTEGKGDGSMYSSVHLWDAETGAHIATIDEVASGSVTNIAHHPTEPLIALTHNYPGGAVCVVNYETRSKLGCAGGGGSGASSAAFSPDGSLLIYKSEHSGPTEDNKKITIVDSFTLEPHTRIESTSSNMIFSLDGDYILRGEQLLVFEQTPRFPRDKTMAVVGVGLISNPRYHLVAMADENRTVIWQMHDGAIVESYTGMLVSDARLQTQLSPDGTYILSYRWDSDKDDYEFVFWDIGDRKIQSTVDFATLGLEQHQTYPVAFSPTGPFLVAATASNDIVVWNFAKQHIEKRFGAHADLIRNLKVSSDGRFVLTKTGVSTAHIWELATGSQQAVANGKDAYMYFSFHPDNQHVIGTQCVALVDNFCSEIEVLWFDISSGAFVETRRFAEVFSPTVILNSDGRAALMRTDPTTWTLRDLETGDILHEINTGSEFSIADFSPDGRYVMLGGDERIAVWELDADTLVRELHDPSGEEMVMTFSPAGDTVFASSCDGGVQGGCRTSAINLWRIHKNDDELMAWICANRYLPLLTPAQVATYGLNTVQPICDSQD
jgi:WD40 repeat protein